MKLILLPCFRCVTKLVIIFNEESYDKYRSRISRCISEGLCEEDQGFPTFLMDMKNPWKRVWKRVMQLAGRKSEKVNGNEVALSVTAIECGENQNSDLEKVSESETIADDQTEQSWTRGASHIQRAQIADSTEEKVQEEQVHGRDQIEGLYIEWLEIMFEISAKKSIAEKKETKIQNQKTINERKILEEQTLDWYQIFSTIHWQVKAKVIENCKGGKMTSEWSEVLENVGNIEKKLIKKCEEEANSEHTEKDQTSDWDEIFEKSGDILSLIGAAGKIERARAIQLAMAARDKDKKSLFGDMEMEGSEDDGEESNDDSDSDGDSDSDADSDNDNGNDSEK
jgi:hypothetical protein